MVMNRVKSSEILGRGRRSRRILTGVVTVSLILVAWGLVSGLGLVEPRFLPTPRRVFHALTDLKPNILVHAAYTAGLVVIGLPVGTLAGVYVGLWMRRSAIARNVLTPIIEAWRPVPPVAIVPFFILWFGFAWYGKLLLVALGSFLIVVIGVVEAVDRLEPIFIRIGRSFGANRSTLVDHILLPAIVPSLLAPLRIALAVSITLAVIAEFMGATRGIGHVLNTALSTFAIHTVLLCAVVLGLLGGLLDYFLRRIHARLTRWAPRAEDAIQLKTRTDEYNNPGVS